MMYPYYGYGPSGFEIVWHILGIVFTIAIIIWLLRLLMGRWGSREMRRMWSADPALEILNERYAKGEINKEEYEERKKTLLGY